MNIIITGGAGFIGSNLTKYLINNTDSNVLVIDKLTYAGNKLSLISLEKNDKYTFVNADIVNKKSIKEIFKTFKPTHIMHLAAESHVDRSIDSYKEFVNTNIIGTITLLDCSKEYMESLNSKEKEAFRFLHISTDEVYGSLGSKGFFTEKTNYDPSSPYSASKAASDHFVRVWNRTYSLPTVITNCSNNYGPYQHPEKLIPKIIINALHGKDIPIYGEGNNIRDWLFVMDHVHALYNVLLNSDIGKTYNIGGNNEKTNVEVAHTICNIMNTKINQKPNKIKDFKDLIKFVSDRPGHDKRYAIDASLIKKELSWEPNETFESGIEQTINWYLDNKEWLNTYEQ